MDLYVQSSYRLAYFYLPNAVINPLVIRHLSTLRALSPDDQVCGYPSQGFSFEPTKSMHHAVYG